MKIFKGKSGAAGIFAAKAIYFEKQQRGEEKISLSEAYSKALCRIEKLKEKATREIGEDEAKIFEAYRMLLCDEVLKSQIDNEIKQGESTLAAVGKVTEKMAAALAKKDNEYLKRRADDILYVGGLIKDAVCGEDDTFAFPNDGESYIVAAKELTPVDTMTFDKKRLKGIVTLLGGATSHTVILAKSLGIPAIYGAESLEKIINGQKAIIDGGKGVLITEPDKDTESKYEKLIKDREKFLAELERIKKEKTKTLCGEKISLCINIGRPSDLEDSDLDGIDGVGLFRSEFLYSDSPQKPTLQEQISAYREVISKMSGKSVTVRTLDIGGDKRLDYIDMPIEENPFLGRRGIRLCLRNKELFSEQLRAILIAAANTENVKIMIPMVTAAREIEATRKILEEIKAQLVCGGVDFCKSVSLGIMIETPASAIMADAFAKRCDFFSIGTNDLIQYITASDRGNSEVEEIYSPYSPAVIQMLAKVIKAGERQGIEVSVCGDLAANPDFTKLLLGLGLKKFSVPLPIAQEIKYKIRGISLAAAKETAKKVLAAQTEEEVKNILKEEEK